MLKEKPMIKYVASEGIEIGMRVAFDKENTVRKVRLGERSIGIAREYIPLGSLVTVDTDGDVKVYMFPKR